MFRVDERQLDDIKELYFRIFGTEQMRQDKKLYSRKRKELVKKLSKKVQHDAKNFLTGLFNRWDRELAK